MSSDIDASDNDSIKSDPPLETEIVEGETQEEPKNDSENEANKKVVKPKKVIRRPQLKFNEDTLKQAKGLSAIKGHFKNLNLKGKGYEEHDLNMIMKTYEHWCHRLFPKYTFDDCIARLEVLGTKRNTQVYLKRIRMGLDDFEEENKMASDDEIPTAGFVEPFDDRFDHLVTTNILQPEPEITEEQLERMRQNKMRAEALRQRKLSQVAQQTEHLIGTNASQNQDNAEQTTEMEIDNLLDFINESVSPNTTTIDSQKNKDERIVNSIRSARFQSLLYNNSDGEDETIVKSSQKKRSILNEDESNKISGDESVHSTKESGQDTDADSIILNKLNRQKKKLNNFKKQQKKRIMIVSGESSDEDSTTSKNKIKMKKRIAVQSDEDSDISSTNIIPQTNNNRDKKLVTTNGQPRKRSVLESDEDSNDSRNISASQQSKITRNKTIDLDSAVTTNSQSSSIKAKKKRIALQSDDSSDISEKESVTTNRQSSSVKAKKKISVLQSDEDSNDSRNSVSQHSKISHNNDSDKESVTTNSQKSSSIKTKKKRAIGQSDEDSNDSRNSVSQQSKISRNNDSDKESFTTNSQKSSSVKAKKKRSDVQSDEDSNDSRNSISQPSKISSNNYSDKESVTTNSQSSSVKAKKKRSFVQSDENSNDSRTSVSQPKMSSNRDSEDSSSISTNSSIKAQKKKSVVQNDEDSLNLENNVLQKSKKTYAVKDKTNKKKTKIFVESDDENNVDEMNIDKRKGNKNFIESDDESNDAIN